MDEEEGDVFFHFSAVNETKFHKGDRVEFTPTMEEKGIAAVDIEVLSKA